ncbi:Uncharacterised protein at_DN1704, partial [Pycnogonum litorale]
MTKLLIINTTEGFLCTIQRPSPIYELNYYMYGYVAQVLCVLGIIGNLMNLIVLSKTNINTVCYTYMRSKAITDLIAIIFTFPWAARHLKLTKTWRGHSSAFYHCYLELYLMNAFVTAGIFLMVAITIERFLSVCYPLKARAMLGTCRRTHLTTVALIVVIALIVFIPYCFQSHIGTYVDVTTNSTYYTYCGNEEVTFLFLWRFYRWAQQAVCRFIPVILIAVLNISIIIGFKKIVKKRQRMKGRRVKNNVDFREQRRMTFMLLGISAMFFVCVTPAAVSIGKMSGENKKIVGFQIFRAVANFLEIINYTFSFYAYCFASSEFRYA